MKHILIKSLLLLLLYGCGEKQNASENAVEENEAIAIKMFNEIEAENKHITDELKTITPITAKEIDIWIPKSINAFERTSYSPNAQPEGFILITKATFEIPNSTKKLDLTMMDGAGVMGSITITPFFDLKRIYPDKKTKEGYQKVIEKNGKTVFQKYNNHEDIFLIEFVSQKRYVVLIESESLTEEELWHAIDQFHFEKLPGI